MRQNINGKTKILGVIGDPIEHSLSPAIHNTICKHLNLNYVYIPMHVHAMDLEKAILGLKSIGMKGFNVTIPHKEKIIPLLDEVSQEALLMGAVNTVKNIDGRLYGYNTDGHGFVNSLIKEKVAVKDQNVVILGAGGAVRGIAIQLALEGVKQITILNRTIEKAKDICDIINHNIRTISNYNSLNSANLNSMVAQCDILINATPLGMYPNIQECPVEDLSFINKNMVVCDLIYNPEKTLLLKHAEEKGCKIVNGWGMLVLQAVKAFEIWTELKVEDNIIQLLLDGGGIKCTAE